MIILCKDLIDFSLINGCFSTSRDEFLCGLHEFYDDL